MDDPVITHYMSEQTLDDAIDEIERLTTERDDYKARWENTGCTRHSAMEAAIRCKERLQAKLDKEWYRSSLFRIV